MAGEVLEIFIEEVLVRVLDICMDMAAVTSLDKTGTGVDDSGKLSSKVPAPVSI